MPILTQGNSIDLTANGDSTLTLQSPVGGFVTVENPVGTVIWRGGQSSRQIDIKSGTVRITANTRDVDYALNTDPLGGVPVLYDQLTGQMTANGSPVSGAGNRRFSSAIRHCGDLKWVSAVNSSYSYQQMWSVPFDFEAVAFQIVNGGSGVAFDCAGIVAPTGALADVAGSPSNGGVFANVLNTSGSSTLSVPAGPGGTGISVLTTDYTDCPSVARTDDPASPFRLALGRFVVTTAGNPSILRSNTAGLFPQHNAIAGGYQWDCYFRSSDNVTTNQGGFSGGVRTTNIWPNVFPIFLARQLVSSLAVIGDSTMGDNGTAYSPGWRGFALQMAQNLATLGRPYVMPLNICTSGRTAQDFHSDAAKLLPVLKPSVALILAASINSTYTAAALRSQWTSLIKALNAARSAGVQPVVATPWPQTYGANAAARSAYLADVLAFCASTGIPVLDLDARYGAGSGAARTWAAGTNADADHPTLATMQDAAAAASSLVLGYL